MFGPYQALCRWMIWSVSVAFGVAGVVATWGGFYVPKFWGDAVMWFLAAWLTLRTSERFR